MNNLVDYIQKLKVKASNHPLLVWLKNSSAMSAEAKLQAWVPVSTVFGQMFKDVCLIGLQYSEEEEDPSSLDPLKAAINEHAQEDGEHYKMLQADLEMLGLNKSMQLNGFLQFFFGGKTESMRRNAYELMFLVNECKDPVLRYVLISTLEVCGGEKFKAVAELGDQYHKETGKTLAYYGQEHVEHEDGHVQCSPNNVAESAVWEMEVSEELLKKAKFVVDATFKNAMDRWNLDLEFAKMRYKPFSP